MHGWGVSARRSSPASASPSSCSLVAFFLVLPKMGQVKDANAALADGAEPASDAGRAAGGAAGRRRPRRPANRETIRKVQQAIPPTVDQQGFMLLMQNAAVQSAVDVVHDLAGQPRLRPGHRALDGDELDLGHRDAISRSRSSCSRSRRFPARRRRPRCDRAVAVGDEREPADAQRVGRHLHERPERRARARRPDRRSAAGLDDRHDPHRPHRRLAGRRDETGSLTDAAERTRPQGPEDRRHRRRRAGARVARPRPAGEGGRTALPPLSVGPSVERRPDRRHRRSFDRAERERVSFAERRTRPEPDLLRPRSVLVAAAVPGRPATGHRPTGTGSGGTGAAPAPDRRAPAPAPAGDRSRTDRADPAADERLVDDHRRS